MGATEELLLSMPDAVGEDGTVYLTIDPDTRKISVPASETTFGVMTDKDSERKYFRCPRIVGDNLDLSQHKIYISYVSTNSNVIKELPDADGRYWCDDVAVDGDYITFSWKLSGNVFKTPGFVAFKVLACTNDGDVDKTRWNTAPAFGTILLTVPDGEDIAERYPDVITQLLERMDNIEQQQGGTGTGLSKEAIDKLEEVGNYLAYTTADGGSKWTELISILRNGSSGGGSGETEVTPESISATYTGGDVVEGTALSDLTGITVTATYSDGSTSNVTDYSLSGTILVGINTITVHYQGLSSTFDVVGIENTSSGVYGVSLAWELPDYNEWAENGNWFHTHYSESTASIQVGNGFGINRVYSKPIDGLKYKYFRIPTQKANGMYSVSNGADVFGCDSPNALTESGHVVTKCTKNFQFVEADFDSSSDTEGFTIIYPSEDYAYYYIGINNTGLASLYPDLFGIFDAGILENPLADPTE